MATHITKQLDVPTGRHADMVDITASVTAALPAGFTGMCFLFCQHTTAGLTINENADPDVVHDMLLDLERLVPWRNPAFRHGEGNSAAHVKATLVGADLAIPATDGHLQLGVWQAVYFCEFDGPRQRRVLLRLQPDHS